MEDINRKVEEGVRRRMEELEAQYRLALQALKDGDSTSPEHRDRESELHGCREGGVCVEKEIEIASNTTRSPATGTSNPPCESPRRHGEDYVPGGDNRPTTPQSNLEHPKRGEGPELSFVHVQAESTPHFQPHEVNEVPPVPQTRQSSTKGTALSQTSEAERARERKRLNKSIRAAIEKDGHDEDKLRVSFYPGLNSDNNIRRDPKLQNKIVSRAYVAAARKALDRHDPEYALELLQQAVSRNPQNAKLLELCAPVFYRLCGADYVC